MLQGPRLAAGLCRGFSNRIELSPPSQKILQVYAIVVTVHSATLFLRLVYISYDQDSSDHHLVSSALTHDDVYLYLPVASDEAAERVHPGRSERERQQRINTLSGLECDDAEYV